MRILDIFHNVSYLINSSLVEVNQAIFAWSFRIILHVLGAIGTKGLGPGLDKKNHFYESTNPSSR